MKIAISIPDDVFREIEKIAGERNVSRSQVFAEAARDFIRRSETRRLVDKLNEVYSVPEGQEEAADHIPFRCSRCTRWAPAIVQDRESMLPRGP